MEFLACIVGGAFLIVCGVGLSKLRPPDWQSDGDLADAHRSALARWSFIQRVVRLVNNSLLALIGVAIMVSSIVPHGRSWMILWSVILMLLLLSIMLAMLDALSSLASYRRALPEAARRSFSSDREHPAS